MALKTEKAGPVAGTDLRNSDLAIKCSEHSPDPRTLQASRLTRRCAVSAVMAAILAPLIFGEVSR